LHRAASSECHFPFPSFLGHSEELLAHFFLFLSKEGFPIFLPVLRSLSRKPVFNLFLMNFPLLIRRKSCSVFYDSVQNILKFSFFCLNGESFLLFPRQETRHATFPFSLPSRRTFLSLTTTSLFPDLESSFVHPLHCSFAPFFFILPEEGLAHPLIF